MGGHWVSYSFIVHLNFIQSVIERYENERDDDGCGKVRVLEWEEWGPDNTRLLQEVDEETGLLLTPSEEFTV